MSNAAFMAFLAASVVLAVTPGPGVLYIVTRTLAQGRAAGIGSVAGVACGNLLNACGAAVGLAALFAVSSVAFTLVQFAGAAYLVFLGLRLLRASGVPGVPAGPAASIAAVPVARLFREGLLVALLNPKTTLFFAAFLPQFMSGDKPALLQAIGLGAMFVGIAACTDLLYALLAAWVAPRLQSVAVAPAWGRWISGFILIALGVMSALAGLRPAR